MLVQNGQVRFIHFLFLVFFWQPKCRRMQGTASVNLHLRLFPAVMSSLSSNRLAMLLPNRAWQTRPFEDMCRRQKTYNRIKAEVRQIVADELQRIQSDPELQHLLQNK